MPMSAQLRSRAPSYPSTARPSHEVLAAHSAAQAGLEQLHFAVLWF